MVASAKRLASARNMYAAVGFRSMLSAGSGLGSLRYVAQNHSRDELFTCPDFSFRRIDHI